MSNKNKVSVLELGNAVYSRFLGLNNQFSKSDEFVAFNGRINRNRKTWESFVSDFKSTHNWDKLGKVEKQKLLNFLDYIRRLCNVKARPKARTVSASADNSATKAEASIKTDMEVKTENQKRQFVLAILAFVGEKCKWTQADTVANILQYTASKADLLSARAVARKVQSIKSA